MRSNHWLALWTLSLFTLPQLSLAAPLAPAINEVRLHLRAGDVDAAVDASDELVEQRDSDAVAWLWAGRAYGRQALEANLLTKAKWAGKTREAWEKAVELDPKLIDARLDLIQYYLSAPGFLGGGRDKADLQAKAIAELDASTGKFVEAILAQSDKDEPRAEALYREALQLDPANRRARMSLSGFLQSKQRYAEVRGLWQERLAQAPDDAMATYQIGRLAAVTGEDLEQGLAALDRFLTLEETPDELSPAAAQWRRGQLLEKLGRIDEARAAFQLGLADPSVAELAQADLDRIGKG